MALSSILEKIQKKGIIRKREFPKRAPQNEPLTSSIKSLASGERPVDPVVARLKAARKAEREKQEQLMRQRKGLVHKQTAVSSTSKQPTRSSASSYIHVQREDLKNGKEESLRKNSSPLQHLGLQQSIGKNPKMSFTELMQKASSIDQWKLSIQLQPSKSPDSTKSAPFSKSVTGKSYESVPRNRRQDDRSSFSGTVAMSRSNDSTRDRRPLKTPTLSRPVSHYPSRKSAFVREVSPPPPQRAPVPIRKPSTKLQEILRKSGRLVGSEDQRQSYKAARGFDQDDENEENRDDDDLDSFIASEDEEAVEDVPDYDRDEIWSMFNRGRKRTYYDNDSDSDDMEATGAEILAEEARSKRNALEEDKWEQEEEKRLAALKRARKLKHSGSH